MPQTRLQPNSPEAVKCFERNVSQKVLELNLVQFHTQKIVGVEQLDCNCFMVTDLLGGIEIGVGFIYYDHKGAVWELSHLMVVASMIEAPRGRWELMLDNKNPLGRL